MARFGPRWRAALRWTVGLGLLGVVIGWADIGSIAGRLAGVDRASAAVGVMGLVAVHLVGALAWQRLTNGLAGVRIGWSAAVRLYYGGQAFGALTPANLGSDLFRIAALDAGAERGAIAAPIVAQRVTSLAAMVALGGLAAAMLPIDGSRWVDGALLVTAAMVVVALGVGARRAGAAAALARRIGLDPALLASPAARASLLRDGLGLGLVFHATSLLLGLLLVSAVDPETVTRPGVVLAALALARLSLVFPLAPSGIGVQEGVLALLFVQLGLPPDSAIVGTLLNRLALLLTAALGSIAMLGARPGRLDRAAHAAPSGPAAG